MDPEIEPGVLTVEGVGEELQPLQEECDKQASVQQVSDWCGQLLIIVV